jgi:hypothetical protein
LNERLFSWYIEEPNLTFPPLLLPFLRIEKSFYKKDFLLTPFQGLTEPKRKMGVRSISLNERRFRFNFDVRSSYSTPTVFDNRRKL